MTETHNDRIELVDATAAHIEQLRGLPLRSLVLRSPGFKFTKAIGQILQSLPLEHFALNWSTALSHQPACLSGLTGLRSLEMAHAGFNDDCLAAIAKLELRSLNIEASSVTEEGLAHLAGMPLESLSLKGARYLDSLFDTLCALRDLPLKELNLADLNCFSNEDLAALEGFRLEDLDLGLNDVTVEGLTHLAGLPLKRLGLAFAGSLPGSALRLMADLGLPLENLNLSGVELKDADLAGLRRLPLKTLHLHEAPWLTDAGVRLLDGLPLRRLTIGAGPGESRITDACLPVLANLPLQELWLPNCTGISAKGWAQLAALPACVVGPGIPSAG